MPNQPAENTVTASFTMPAALLAQVKAKAKRKMTNQSDILRQALMNDLTPEEQAWVLKENASSEKIGAAVESASKKVSYIARKPRKRASE